MIKCLFSAFLLASTSVLLMACSNDSEKCSDRSKVYVGSIDISEKEDSKALEDLECVQIVTGNVSISDPAIESLEALSSLIQVQGNLEITDVKKLSSLKGLEQLTDVGGNLDLSDLKLLKTFDGLGSLETIGGDLSVTSNDNLTTIQGLDSLSRIQGKFDVSFNPKLTSVAINDAYVRVPDVGSVSIFANDSLKTLKGFGIPLRGDKPCLYYNGNSGISIVGNTRLEEIELPDSRNICVSIADNTLLNTISAHDTFASYNVSLTLLDLPKLKNIALHNWIFYSLAIQETDLETLDTLIGNGVFCNLDVTSNPRLKDISALEQGFGLVAGRFDFYQNPELATCDIQTVANALPVTDKQCLTDEGITQGPRVIEINGNNDSATCE